MPKPKRLNRKRELKRIDEQVALLDRWYTTVLTDEVGYDPKLVGDVATKLLSDLALVVMLRNGLRHERQRLLTWDDQERELVDVPQDRLLLGWLARDAATIAELDALAKQRGVRVPELIIERLRQARSQEAAGR